MSMDLSNSEDTDDTQIRVQLERLHAGDQRALDRLLPLVLSDLRRLARAQRQRLNAGETLCTTALIHEAYLKLRRHKGLDVASGRHFLHTAALAMRQILIDHARSRIAEHNRHVLLAAGGDQQPHALQRQAQQVLDVDEALAALDAQNPRLALVVNYRYFAGYSEKEIANLLDISTRSVRRDWLKSRAWLATVLREPVIQP